jgi:hypothetical protein
MTDDGYLAEDQDESTPVRETGYPGLEPAVDPERLPRTTDPSGQPVPDDLAATPRSADDWPTIAEGEPGQPAEGGR